MNLKHLIYEYSIQIHDDDPQFKTTKMGNKLAFHLNE
jgi:hypothetical protein